MVLPVRLIADLPNPSTIASSTNQYRQPENDRTRVENTLYFRSKNNTENFKYFKINSMSRQICFFAIT